MGLILFVAELGGGFGHVRRLLPVARAAIEDGHRPLFLTGNAGEVAPLLAAAGIEGAAAPSVAQTGRVAGPPPGSVATSFADILGGAGFADAGFLRAMTDAWDGALARLRPVAIVCEMSPFLALAAFGGDVPVLSLGYGFILPPPHLPRFSPLLDGAPLYAEAALLEHAADACLARGRSAPDALPALLAGTAHAVTGMDVLDPYRGHRERPAVGPPELEVDRFGREPGEDVFAYLLGDAALTLEILRALGVAAVVPPAAPPSELAGALSSAARDPVAARAAREVADRHWREAAPAPGLARRLLGAVTSA